MFSLFWIGLIFFFLFSTYLTVAECSESFYPFRVQISVEVSAAGEYLIDLTPQMITDWMNKVSDFKFKYQYFDYDSVKLVEVSSKGTVINPNVKAGYQIMYGPELMKNPGFEEQENGRPTGWIVTHEAFKLEKKSHDGSWCMTVVEGSDRRTCGQIIPTKPYTWYRYSHMAKGLDVSAGPYIFNKFVSNRIRPRTTYFDPYTPIEGWYHQEFFFYTGDKSDWTEDELQVNFERSPGSVDDVSLRECQVAFVLKTESLGTKHYLLYYSPSEGITPSTPSIRVDSFPSRKLAINLSGEPQWFDDGIVYSIYSSDFTDVWHASSVRKVMENDLPPTLRKEKVTISCSRNESEAFQLVLRPKIDGKITKINATLTGPNGIAIKPEHFDIRRAHYVTIHNPSLTGANNQEPSRSEFTGRLPDPLPKFVPLAYKAGEPNILIWVDVTVPKDFPAGIYTGNVTFSTSSGEINIPLELTVWNFTLPDRMTCRSSLQFAQYDNQYLFPFHKVETLEDEYSLSRAYTAEMARYKINPLNPFVAGAWNPKTSVQAGHTPVEQQTGTLEIELPWVLNDLKLSSFQIDKESGHSLAKETTESAKKTAERYEEWAKLLSQKDYLKYSYFMIDEPRHEWSDGISAWIEAFRMQPHAKDIKMLAAFYNTQVYEVLRDHIDIFVPINNDYGSCVSPGAISHLPPGKEVWFYWTNTVHQWIDSPGINHRLLAPKVWAFGGKGLLSAGINQWWTLPKDPGLQFYNPWENPFTPWGNGVLCYFYPPSPLSENLTEKDMTIVPSLRLVLTREGIEDFEYAVILERLIKEARAKGKETAKAEDALAMFKRQFKNPISWKLGEAYWEEVRSALAESIVSLQ